MCPFSRLAVTCLALSAPASGRDIVINEVEFDGLADFIELMNTGGAPVDVSGYVLKDNNDANTLAIPGGTTIPAGGFLAVDTDVVGRVRVGAQLGAGVHAGRRDADRQLQLDRARRHDLWPLPRRHGRLRHHTAVTKGAANACPAPARSHGRAARRSPRSTRRASSAATSAASTTRAPAPPPGACSGTSTTATAGWMRLVWNGTQWVRDTTNGWSAGKTLRFPGGTGLPDSEGVTLTDAGSAGGVFVSSERNLSAAKISRISVLRYDVSGAAASLTATREWNLTADLPVVGANAGAESVEWVPDTYLVGSGFIDETTNQPYDPADYPGHGTGLFFVGLEANGTVYVYALDQTSGSFTRVATFASGFPTFGALHLDPDENQLWVVCDNNCDGRSRVFQVNSSGNFAAVAEYARPTGMANLNNEGFTFTRDSECVGGFKPVYWADDDNTGGNALRAGTIRCTPSANDVLIDFGSERPLSASEQQCVAEVAHRIAAVHCGR